MENILVSVIMATYNDSVDYLEQSINSILNQTYKNFELIIVDDSDETSTINYLEDISKKDERVKFISNDGRKGFTKSLNIGIESSKGEYIARMDSDDISFPDRLRKQVELLDKNPDISILGSNIEIIDENGVKTGVRTYKTTIKEIAKVMYFRNPVAHPTVMYRREVINKIGFYDETFIAAEDYEFWLRAVKKGCKIYNIPEVLLRYRMNDNYRLKRNRHHWKYSIKSKCKNFSSKYFCRNILGIVITAILCILPKVIIKKAYEADRSNPYFYR